MKRELLFSGLEIAISTFFHLYTPTKDEVDSPLIGKEIKCETIIIPLVIFILINR